MVVIASTLVFAPTAITLLYYNPSLAAAAQSPNPSQHISPSNTTSTYLKKLQKNEGSNSQIIANNTKIGSGHTFQTFGKEHKIKASTPKSIKALPLHPQLRNMTSAASAGSSNKTGGNVSASATNSTKK